MEQVQEVTECPEPVEEQAKPEAPPMPKPIVVSQVDRLMAENVNLKLIAAVNRETILQMQLNEASKERMRRTEELQAIKVQLERKYGFNLSESMIQEHDGLVVPRVNGAVTK